MMPDSGWALGQTRPFTEMGNFKAGGALGKMVRSASDRLNLSYALWDPLRFGRDVWGHMYCVNGIPWHWATWWPRDVQLDNGVRSPGRCLSWRGRSEK